MEPIEGAMRQVGSCVEKAALTAALEALEESRKTGPKPPEVGLEGQPTVPARARGKAPARTQSKAQGNVESFADTRRSRTLAEAKLLEGLAKKAGLSPVDAAALADGLRAQLSDGWTFVMLSPSQNGAVVRWLFENSTRPHMAVLLWTRLFEVLRHDTGEVLASRSDLAGHLGVSLPHVSTIMGELASINAIRKERQGRGVRYFMNSSVATSLPGAAARQAARSADGPLLVAVEGGKAGAPR
jgi:hypothetical protein